MNLLSIQAPSAKQIQQQGKEKHTNVETEVHENEEAYHQGNSNEGDGKAVHSPEHFCIMSIFSFGNMIICTVTHCRQSPGLRIRHGKELDNQSERRF